MSKITKFQYEGDSISFEFNDGNQMINATQMAKPFGKLVADFLRLKATKDYSSLLQERYVNSHIVPKRAVIRVVKGGDASEGLQGTWMDEKLALKFAAWLSPEFELWVYDRIEELLKTGKTKIRDIRPGMDLINSIRLIADQLEYHERDIEKLKDDMVEVKDYIADIEAKIISIDENYYSISGYCALNSVPCPLDKAQKWGHAATKLSNQKSTPIGKAYDAKYGDINTYHLDILAVIVKP
jgi:hypothetical protein